MHYAEVFSEFPPALSFVEVSRLLYDATVEIEAAARRFVRGYDKVASRSTERDGWSRRTISTSFSVSLRDLRS